MPDKLSPVFFRNGNVDSDEEVQIGMNVMVSQSLGIMVRAVESENSMLKKVLKKKDEEIRELKLSNRELEQKYERSQMDLESSRKTAQKYHDLNVELTMKILKLEKRMEYLEKKNDIFDLKFAEIYESFVKGNEKKEDYLKK